MEDFMIDRDLEPGTPLYRYMNIETFMSSVESRQVHLTNINFWSDKWEGILSKIPMVDDKGERIVPGYSFHQYIYAQCWSRIRESDAMWRIYSPTGTGVQIKTSVEKFKLIRGVKRWYLGNVVYFETVADLLEKNKGSKRSPFHNALHKRSAFDHEQEVRLLTHGHWLAQFDPEQMHIALPVDLSKFIEGVTLDPRAEDWYVNTIERYCERVDLSVKPVRSRLYDTNPHLKVGLVQRYVPVKKDGPERP